ncbi:MAG: polysaccharide biosynthesis protein [Clostridia bacterium]|nr:polysaccharide biosynthesis protein [Clostridia bacterium]
MAKGTKSIVGGMTVLGLTGIICKLVGVLFVIPLTWLIGADGLGVYQAVFPTYNLLLTVSSAGLPVAISRMVSHYLAKDDPRGAKRVFRSALWLLAALGLVCTLFILVGSGMLAQRVSMPESRSGFIVIAPCVLIVCVLSAFRGFMQGQQNMAPTAASQLIEQVGKVFVSLPLAYIGSRAGIAEGAAGALLGTTIVEALALLYMVILYYRRRGAFDALPQLSAEPSPAVSSVTTQLMKISIPITISACIVPLAQFVDSAMLVDRMVHSGMTITEARPLYGLFTGMVIRLINIPTALALAVSMSLVPAISSAKATENYDVIRRQSDLGLRFAFLIGFPCSIGMSLLSRQIISFFYASTLTAEHLQISSELLSMSALTVVLFTVVQATTSILQGLGKQRIPMYTLIAGVGCKILLNYILVGIPGVGIHGGPIASIVCYSVSMIPNLYFVVRYIKKPFNWMGWVIRPAAATACMGVVVAILRTLLPINHFTTILEIAVGVAVYVAAALALKAVSLSDFASLRRKGRR